MDAPRNWIFYVRGSKPRVTVSGALLSRKADALFRAPDGARTCCVPDTVRNIRNDAFARSDALRALWLGRGVRSFDAGMLTDSKVQRIAAFAELDNVDQFLARGNLSRAVVL